MSNTGDCTVVFVSQFGSNLNTYSEVQLIRAKVLLTRWEISKKKRREFRIKVFPGNGKRIKGLGKIFFQYVFL